MVLLSRFGENRDTAFERREKVKIRDVVPYHLQCSLSEEEVFRTPDTIYDKREIVVVKVYTDEGLVGLGECIGVPDVVIPIIENVLKPLIIGEDPLDTSVLWSTMLRGIYFRAQTATWVEALSGIDIALWDIKGKALNLPIHKLLGGPYRQSIPVYANGLYLDTLEALERGAVSYVERGFKAIKMKLGYPGGIRQDIESVSRVRRVIGDDIVLMIDSLEQYDLSTAVILSEELAGYDISWMQDPLKPVFGPHYDLEGYQQLKAKISIPIAWGAGEYLLAGSKDYLVKRCVDIVQADVCRSGGITECSRIAVVAKLFGVRYSPHFWTTGIGLAATLHLSAAAQDNFLICEYDQSPNPLREELVVPPPVFDKSALAVPQGAGLGVELDEKAFHKYSS